MKTMPGSAETFSVRLPEETRRNVDKLATLTKRSRSFIINEAVEAYVNDRMAYLADLETAVQTAESGPGHSGEQIFKWMRSWGQADELPSPKPDLPKRG
jgi:predicted transcriptional regulator